MNNLHNSFSGENFWPTLASIIVPLSQLLAVFVTDISHTLKLEELFLDSEILSFANLLSMIFIAGSIGFYWYWKENYNWFNFGGGENRPRNGFPQNSIKNLLFGTTILTVLSVITLVTSIVLGRSSSELFLAWRDLIAVVQIVSYVLFITSVGVTAYIGLGEYSISQRKFKPDQYLGNLRISIDEYGVARPNIQIREKRNLKENSMNVLVQLDIDNVEKYLITSWDGKEITQVLSGDEYRAAVNAQNQT